MKVGITGHQQRDGADWNWVAASIRSMLHELERPLEGWSSLAAGADQVFAREIIASNGSLIAVIPTPNYKRFFHSQSHRKEYEALMSQSARIVELNIRNPQTAFLAASNMIVRETSLLIAVWDQEPSRGRGGTADVVDLARAGGKQIVILNPVTKVQA